MTLARRRHVRVPVDVPVWFFSGPNERTRATARDVSLSGMRLDGSVAGSGNRIYLEFALPHHRDFPVMAIGRVVWRASGNEPSFGVEVLRYFPSGRFAVQSFLDRSRRKRINYNVFDEA